MTMRLLHLPNDFVAVGEMLGETFQYPENASWSVQRDEKEQMLESVKNYKRIWPIVRLIQLISPPARDLMRGYVWEEEEGIVGITTVQRRGGSKVWIVGTVGVLPAFRRRGIARKLVESALELIRDHGGERTFLGVIDGNLPAYQLYESLGFEHYSGSIEFQLLPEKPTEEPDVPEGYSLMPLKQFDWQPRFELEKRITPEPLFKYEPVEIERFKIPLPIRLLWPLLMFAQNTRIVRYAIRTSTEGNIVATCGYSIPTRGVGLNTLQARLDPEHPELAPFMLQFLLHKVTTLSPGRRVEFSIPHWMGSLVSATESAGFERRLEYCYMGLVL